MVGDGVIDLLVLDTLFDEYNPSIISRRNRSFNPHRIGLRRRSSNMHRRVGRPLWRSSMHRLPKPRVSIRRRRTTSPIATIRNRRRVYSKPNRIVSRRSVPKPTPTTRKPANTVIKPKPKPKAKQHPIKLTPNDTVVPYQYNKKKPVTGNPFAKRDVAQEALEAQAQLQEVEPQEPIDDMTKKKEETPATPAKKGISPMFKIGLTVIAVLAIGGFVLNNMAKAKVKSYDN